MKIKNRGREVRRFSLNWHRDLGYLFAPLIIIYSLSGITLNHIDEFNPDFIIVKKQVSFTPSLSIESIDKQFINSISKEVGENKFKLYDSPNDNRVRVYFDNATLDLNLKKGIGNYERITKRSFFYESNLLHRNSVKGWKWFSDVFAVILIFISITGFIIIRGKYGFFKRGWWLMVIGTIIPIVGILIFYFFQ